MISSFPKKNLTNSVAHRSKTDEISRLTKATQMKFRGLIKSWIVKYLVWTYESFFIH